jgi:hypothetical protein
VGGLWGEKGGEKNPPTPRLKDPAAVGGGGSELSRT